MGRDIKINLYGQSEKMGRAGDNLGNMQGELTISNRLLNIIRRNEMRNKITLYCVVLFLLISVVLILYFKFFK